MNLSLPNLHLFHEAISVIRSREMLYSLNVSSYPNMADRDRDKLYKETRNKAFPNEARKILRFDQMGEIFNGRF